MTERRHVEIEVPGTPEEVWDAIATGPGITAWFMPAEVADGRLTLRHGPGEEFASPVTASEPPRRFAFDDGSGATEFLVEAQSGSTCVVRIVFSGFGDEGADAGWTAALLGLRLYLERFPGREAASIVAGGMVDGPVEAAWAKLLQALEADEPVEGERFAAGAPGVPPLAGVVAGRSATTATLLIDEPGPGIAFLGVGGPGGDQVYSFLRAQLFGPDRAAVAARDEPAWRALLPPA